MEWKQIFVWLLIFIIGSLIVTFLVSPNSFQSFKSNIKSIIPESSNNENSTSSSGKIVEDSLIRNCKNSFDECMDITETKYSGASVSLVKIEKFTDIQASLDFYDTWKGFLYPSSSAMGKEGVFSMYLGLPTPQQKYICVYENGTECKELCYNAECKFTIVGSFDDIMPFVLMAVKVSRSDAMSGEVSDTVVIACDKEGKLTGIAKRSLFCGA